MNGLSSRALAPAKKKKKKKKKKHEVSGESYSTAVRRNTRVTIESGRTECAAEMVAELRVDRVANQVQRLSLQILLHKLDHALRVRGGAERWLHLRPALRCCLVHCCLTADRRGVHVHAREEAAAEVG